MRILLVDDLELPLESLGKYVERLAPTIDVTTISSLDTACTVCFAKGPFDLILLVLRVMDFGNISGMKRLRERLPGIPMAVILDSRCSPSLLNEFSQLKVSVLSMNCSGTLFLSVLMSIAAGDVYLSPLVMSIHPGANDPGIPFNPEVRPLTPRERQVLAHLSQGMSNKEIALHLTIEEVTVRLHMRGIFRKLGARNRTQAVRHAIERGYVDIPEQQTTYKGPSRVRYIEMAPSV